MSQKYTPYQIEKQLLERTAKKLYTTEAELDLKQKEVISGIAQELSALHARLDQSNDRIQEHILSRLKPTWRKRELPRYGLIQLETSISKSEVNPDTIFTYNGGEIEPFYFSPLQTGHILHAKITYIVGPNHIFEPNQQYSATSQCSAIREGEVWLGIALHKNLNSLDGLSLYIEWDDDRIDEKRFPYTRFILGAQQLAVNNGFPPSISSKINDLEEELWMKEIVEKPILKKFDNNFFYFEGTTQSETIKEKVSDFPLREELISEAKISEEPLLWIKLSFPFTPSQKEINSIRLNCLPVVNRRSVRLQESDMGSEVRIVPLVGTALNGKPGRGLPNEYFLGLQQVFSVKQEFLPAIVEDFENDAPPWSYALRYGQGPDFRLQDIQKQINTFLRLIKEETELMGMIFNMGERNDLKGILEKDIRGGIGKLISLLRSQPINKRVYFLYVKPGMSTVDNLIIRFYCTQGKMLDRMTELKGDKLEVLDTKSTKILGGAFISSHIYRLDQTHG